MKFIMYMYIYMYVGILYAYKFSRHVNFKDVTNQAFSRFYFRGSPSILLSDSCKSKFANEILRMKISRMASENLENYIPRKFVRIQ